MGGVTVLCAMVVLLAASLTAQQATVDQAVKACGPTNASFTVKVDKRNHPAGTPESGTALIYFIEERQISCLFCGKTVRLGVDGSWVGANHDNSYFFVPIAPGEHHLCASWISDETNLSNTALTSFNAVAGNVYYFKATIAIRDVGDRGAKSSGLALEAVNPDQGQFLVALYGFSTFTQP